MNIYEFLSRTRLPDVCPVSALLSPHCLLIIICSKEEIWPQAGDLDKSASAQPRPLLYFKCSLEYVNSALCCPQCSQWVLTAACALDGVKLLATGGYIWSLKWVWTIMYCEHRSSGCKCLSSHLYNLEQFPTAAGTLAWTQWTQTHKCGCLVTEKFYTLNFFYTNLKTNTVSKNSFRISRE